MCQHLPQCTCVSTFHSAHVWAPSTVHMLFRMTFSAQPVRVVTLHPSCDSGSCILSHDVVRNFTIYTISLATAERKGSLKRPEWLGISDISKVCKTLAKWETCFPMFRYSLFPDDGSCMLPKRWKTSFPRLASVLQTFEIKGSCIASLWTQAGLSGQV